MKYKVKDEKFIRVRDKANISGTNKGEISAGNEFFATPVGIPTSTEQWVQITEGKYAGYFGAILYNGQEFADLISSDPIPEVPQFPQSFVLTDPSGARAEYHFVKIIE